MPKGQTAIASLKAREEANTNGSTELPKRHQRDAKGRVIKGSAGPNPYGQPGITGFSISEYGRRFLSRPHPNDNGDIRATITRRQKIFETAYLIAVDPTHKQCAVMIQWIIERAYGAVPKEISINSMALQAILGSDMTKEAKAFLSDLLVGDDPTYLVSSRDEPDLQSIETAKGEVLETSYAR